MKKFSGLVCACSEKSDGNMSFHWGEREEVLKNRKNFLSNFGILQENIVAMFLEHGTEIAFVDESFCGEEALAADCLLTKSKNVFLFVLTGDCLPTIFYDSSRGLLALAHLSRINTPQMFAGKIIERFKKEGSDTKNIAVSIGPGVRKESYAFTVEELAERIAGHDGWKNFFVNLPSAKIGIDLVGYNIHQFVSAGVLWENIEVADIDTITNENFFSHYRSMKTGEKEGRMGTVVGFMK